MQPGKVRPIEYDLVPKSEAAKIGLTADAVTDHLGSMTRVGVLRCVTAGGEKVTAVCDGDHLRTLLASGEASRPSGMILTRQAFPVVIDGWPRAS
jgi:hypothetical protein